MNELKDLSAKDKELHAFIMTEKQKAQLNAQIHNFNEICWEKCIAKPGTKLDANTETCLTNCVDRFIDTSQIIARRFQQLAEKKEMKDN